MKRALIFDMDGVVVKNDRFHCLSWIEFAKKHGKHVEFDEVKSWFGSTNRTILENLFGNPLPPDKINAMGDEKEEIYRNMYAPEIEPLTGLSEFLAEMDGSYLIGLATSAPTENVEFVLRETGLEKFFSSVTDASDILHGKPDPEIFLKAARKLGAEPENCLVFEDSFQGIEAARKAGMYVVGVATTHEASDLMNTDMIIGDFNEMNREKLDLIFKGRHR